MKQKSEAAQEPLINGMPESKFRAHLMAAERMLLIQRARENFMDFVRLMMPDPINPDDAARSRYEAAPHHLMMGQLLESVEKGEHTRICVSIAPRHGKSELFSRMFPAWFIGKDPYRQVILAGASGEFAETEFGRKIKAIITSPMYRQVFPHASLDGGSKAVSNLVFKEGGNIKSIGKGAQIVGRGADLLVCDDIFSGQEEAWSPTEREKIWQWFTSDAMSRLMPGGRVVVVHQRWHVDDLIGRLVDPDHPDHNPDIAKKWFHVKIPAVIKDQKLATALGIKLEKQTDPEVVREFGDQPIAPLWPKFSLKYMAELKTQNSKKFGALYMGDPNPEEGNFFMSDYLVPYRPSELPQNLRFYSASDHAVSTKQSADKTAVIVAGVDERGHVWIMPDCFIRRADSETVVDGMIEIFRKYKPLFHFAEKGHISMSLGPFLKKRMAEENAFTAIVEMTPSKDKMTRAQSFHGMTALHRVHFPTFAPWWPDASSELLRFPEAPHDDIVDACSWLGIGLGLQTRASAPTKARDILPKVGTLGWVKSASKMEEIERRLEKKDGF